MSSGEGLPSLERRFPTAGATANDRNIFRLGHGPEGLVRRGRVRSGGWQWRLGKRLATATGHARANDLAYHEAPRQIFQLLRHILAKRTQGPAAIGAGLARRQNLGLPLEMVGQRGTTVSAFVRLIGLRAAAGLIRFFLPGSGSLCDLGIFLKVESQLVEALGFRPKRALR